MLNVKVKIGDPTLPPVVDWSVFFVRSVHVYHRAPLGYVFADTVPPQYTASLSVMPHLLFITRA